MKNKTLHEMTLEKLETNEDDWIPKVGETVWYVCDELLIRKTYLVHNTFVLSLFKCGWLFRTKEEAENNKDRMLKEMEKVILQMKNKTIYEIMLEKFGLEEGEKFKILSDDYNELLEKEVFHFDGGYLYDEDCESVNGLLLQDLINGNATVEKLPWKPKQGEEVWYVNPAGYIFRNTFSFTTRYLSMLKCGWIFKTEKEAEENQQRILAEMREVLEQ